MTVRLKIDQDDDVREFVFDRGEITIGCGAFNDIVLGEGAGADVHGRLEVEEGAIRFVCSESGVPTSVVREGACISTVGGDEEAELEVRVGDILRFDASSNVGLEIVERSDERRDSYQTFALSDAAAVQPGTTTSKLLWRAVDALGAGSSIENFLRAVAAVVEEVLELRPEQLTLRFLAEEGEVEDHLYRLTLADEEREDGTLVSGTYEQKRAPLAGLGFDRREIVDALEDGETIVARQPSPARANLYLPVGHQNFRGIVNVAFSELDEESNLGRISVAASLVQPLGRIVLKDVDRELERLSLAEENRYFRQRQRRHYLFKDLVCESESMREAYQKVNQWVSLDSPVLVEGEAGSGKSLMARALHHLGPRSEGMFISLDCRELTDDVLDSELFGCVESELVGAVAPRKGVFELADDGTVFLEEIDLLSPMLQGKLLRVLKEGEVRRIGDAVGREVGARLIASTHRELSRLVERGSFRRDLYLVLQEHVLTVPPLRERRDDILPLARVYLRKFAERYERPCTGFSESVAETLESHDWLGNARELKAVVESAVLKSRDEERLQIEHLAL